MGVQEDPQDSWTVVESKSKSKKKKKSDVLQVNKAVSSKKDAVFEGSPSHKDAPFQVPSSSVVDDFPGVNDSVKGDTKHKDQNMFFQCCLEEDPLFAHQVQSLERMLRVRSSGRWSGSPSPLRPQVRSAGGGLLLSAPEFTVSAARSPKFRDGMKATNKRDLDDGMDGVRSALGVRRGSGGAWTARETAGESEINGLLEVLESDFSKNLAESTATDESAAAPGQARLLPLQRMRLQVRVKKSLDLLGCLSLRFHL